MWKAFVVLLFGFNGVLTDIQEPFLFIDDLESRQGHEAHAHHHAAAAPSASDLAAPLQLPVGSTQQTSLAGQPMTDANQSMCMLPNQRMLQCRTLSGGSYICSAATGQMAGQAMQGMMPLSMTGAGMTPTMAYTTQAHHPGVPGPFLPTIPGLQFPTGAIQGSPSFALVSYTFTYGFPLPQPGMGVPSGVGIPGVATLTPNITGVDIPTTTPTSVTETTTYPTAVMPSVTTPRMSWRPSPTDFTPTINQTTEMPWRPTPSVFSSTITQTTEMPWNQTLQPDVTTPTVGVGETLPPFPDLGPGIRTTPVPARTDGPVLPVTPDLGFSRPVDVTPPTPLMPGQQQHVFVKIGPSPTLAGTVGRGFGYNVTLGPTGVNRTRVAGQASFGEVQTITRDPRLPACAYMLQNRIPDRQFCDRYHICTISGLFPMNCPDGLVFDLEREECHLPGSVNCTGRPMRQPAQRVGPCPRRNGVFPIQNSCTNFLICSNGTYGIVECPAGLAFSFSLGACEWPDVAGVPGCLSEQLFNFTCPAVDPERGFQRVANPRDCRSYYVCLPGGAARLLSCPGGTVFSPVNGVCDAPHRVPGCETYYGIPAPPSRPQGASSVGLGTGQTSGTISQQGFPVDGQALVGAQYLGAGRPAQGGRQGTGPIRSPGIVASHAYEPRGAS